MNFLDDGGGAGERAKVKDAINYYGGGATRPRRGQLRKIWALIVLK